MDIFTVFLIAIGLSMDSFAVSVSNGLSIKNLKFEQAFVIALSLAFFQALLPLLGWLAGVGVEQYVKEFDHWIAFVLLSMIGLKMIYEGLQKNIVEQREKIGVLRLLGQSLATSIDAFVVGISFAFLNISIIKPILVIGFVTLFLSLVGLRLGKYLGSKIGQSVEILGGIVLIGIGVKILIEHLFYH